MSNEQNRSGRYSGILNHKQSGKKLITPLGDLPIEEFNWVRDFLPEHLWIDFLSNGRPQATWLGLYNDFLDELDKYCPKDRMMYGLISDFGIIPEDKQKEFVMSNEDMVYAAFLDPFGRIISMYPDSPCNWLLQKEWLDKDESTGSEGVIEELNECVLRLLPGKDLYAGNVRSLPLTRLFRNEKILLPRSPEFEEIIGLLARYPENCSDDEKYRVQQFSRVVLNTIYGTEDQLRNGRWPRSFWRNNHSLVSCVHYPIDFKDGLYLNESDAINLHKQLSKNAEIVSDYLDELAMNFKYDLYETERDEILSGLFSRLTRLYILIASSPDLWSRDVAGIMLRCLTETAITFAYLATVGTEDEFEDFKSYGEGKEKLLMLHLQDTYPAKKSIEGRSSDDIARDLGGGFRPELIDIKLSDWTKKSTRDLAASIGLEEFYRLVFDPASSDIHGTWISIKKSNLVFCGQPLHRFHRIPKYFEPPLLLHTIGVSQQIYTTCLEIGVDKLGFPEMEDSLEDVTSFAEYLDKQQKSTPSM